MRLRSLAAALAASFAIAGPVLAESSSSGQLNIPKDQWQSPAQISEKLAAQGYKVHEIEDEDGAYEVKVTDAKGVRVEMYVHPVTAEALPGYDD